MMYGIILVSIYMDKKKKYYIDIDYAPDGYALTNDKSLEINVEQFNSLVNEIGDLLSKEDQINDYEDGAYAFCIEINKNDGDVDTLSWPDDFKMDNYISICEFTNKYANSNVLTRFINMLYQFIKRIIQDDVLETSS